MKNINVAFIVLEVGPATVTKESRIVRTFKVGDPTACINVSVWDEPSNLLVPGDIVRLTKGYAAIWRQCLTLYSGKNGDIQKIGDFCLIFNEQLNMSEPNLQLAPVATASVNSILNQKNQPTNPNALSNNGTIPNNGNTSSNESRAVNSANNSSNTSSNNNGSNSNNNNNGNRNSNVNGDDSLAPAKIIGTQARNSVVDHGKSAASNTPVSAPTIKTNLRTGRSNQTRSNVRGDRR